MSDDPKRRAVWCVVMDADLHRLEETTGGSQPFGTAGELGGGNG